MISAAVAALACLVLARPPPAAGHSHALRTYTHPAHTTKEFTTILANIEERLRALDTIHAMQTKQNRKIEVMQDKLDRIETTLSLKLERLQLAADRLEHRLHLLQSNMQTSLKENTDQILSSHYQIAEISQNLTSHFDSQKTILDKVHNAYADSAKDGGVLEALARDSLALVNATRRELAEGFRGVARRQGGRLAGQPDLEGVVAKQVSETTLKIDSKIQEVLENQKRFSDSCQRMQLDDPHVADVLEKLIDSLINKTASTFRELQNIQAALRTHDNKAMKLLNTARAVQSDVSCKKLENVLRNATQASIKEQELYQLTEKFVSLTDRADAALQKFEAHMAIDSDEPLSSDVTAEADQLVYKLDSIKNEPDEEDDSSWDEDDQDDGYFDDTGGGDITAEDKEILSNAWNSDEEEEVIENVPSRPPHRRHLHKHPYDRGPSWKRTTIPPNL